MSQHNIVGSEAFTKGPQVIIRGYRASGIRRRRSGSAVAYAIVAILALSAGAAVAAFALGPLLVGSDPANAAATEQSSVVVPAPITEPATTPPAHTETSPPA